jgi:hypothetical protein
MKITITVAAAAISLSACSVTLPVRAQLEGSSVVFTGTATGHLDGAGELSLVFPDGATCNGLFVNSSRRSGEGTVTCTDGRSGSFEFVTTGARGTGHGILNGQRFTFTFG